MLIEIIEEYISEEHQRILKEYRNSTKHKVKNYIRGIVGVPVSFGIGAGLATLGFISPAAIGAIVTIPKLLHIFYTHQNHESN